MTDGLEYALLDLDVGRKLERFGRATVARPDPAADGSPALDGRAWDAADAEFDRDGGAGWRLRRPLPEPWVVRSAGAEFLLELAPAGQVGFFPEQAPLRERVAGLVRAAVLRGASPRALDLFGYTGGTTVALAAAGATVTLVDAVRASVGQARRNFAHNGLGAAPIRSIAEDAATFVAREVRRGSRYDVIVLDPPSFGRGPKGEVWKLEQDLDALLAACRGLLTEKPLFVLVSAHTEGWTAAHLAVRLARALDCPPAKIDRGELELRAASGSVLPAGIFALAELSR
ncbi:MAG: class I SAM-dependent methyltransferase [Candidatus Eiseniibacteriota bacterium]